MKTFNCAPIGQYDVFLHKFVWGYEAVAVPDDHYTRETIRLKMIGYSKQEMISLLRQEIANAEEA